MAKPLRPFVRGGGYYPSKKWIPLVRNGGYTTQNGGETEPVWATVSGAIASFTTPFAYPLKKLVAQINPVQDLHGYENPWPTGGGDNKLNPTKAYKGLGYNPSVGTTIVPETADVQWTDKGNNVYEITNFGSWAQAGFITDVLPQGKAYVSISNCTGALRGGIYVCDENWVVNRVTALKNPITENETFSAETTLSGTDARIVVYLAGSGSTASISKPYIFTGSDASTKPFAPYSNICPISGWTGLSGQNTANAQQWDEEWEVGAISVSDGSLINVPSYMRSKNYIPVASGKTYYRAGAYLSDGRAFFYDQDKAFVGNTAISSVRTFVIPYNASFMKFHKNGASYSNDISINYPSTDTSYHAYTGEPISVSFPSTVYGGTDEVVSGNGTSTHAIVTLDGTQSLSSNGTLAYGGAQIIYTPNPAKAYAVQHETEDLLSNIFHTDGSYADPFYFNGRKTNGNIYFNMPAGVTTVQEAKDWFANNPTQVWYKLATPQSFTHAGQPVDTLVGQNNVWVTSGDVEVTYRIE